MITLGTLERVDVRQIWAHEGTSFTPWLASEPGLKLLSDALGIELEVDAIEKPVGPFRADILARRTDTPEEHWVLVENQLESTDHRHLGQLLTYAAGLHTATIVWVAQNFTEEHRAALDWLNEITSEKFAFYGLEIEAWRIGNSPAAAKLNLVARPNEWSREIKQAGENAPSTLKQQQQRFWQALKEKLTASRSTLRLRAPRPQHWYDLTIGRSGAWLSATVHSRNSQIGVSLALRGPPGKLWFKELEKQRAAIEAEMGEPLTWWELPDKQSSYIGLYRGDSNSTNEAAWSDLISWMAATLEKYDRVFRDRVRALPGDNEMEPLGATPDGPLDG